MSTPQDYKFGIQILDPTPSQVAGQVLNSNFTIVADLLESGVLVDGSRGFTAPVSGVTPVHGYQLARLDDITAENVGSGLPIWNASQLQSIPIFSGVPDDGQVLTYDGSQWISQSCVSGLVSVYDDKTPQLGGPLDVSTGPHGSQPIFNYLGGPIILGGEAGTFLALIGDLNTINYNQGNYCVNLQYTTSGNPAYGDKIGCFGDRCAIVGGDGNVIGDISTPTTSTYYDAVIGGSGNKIGQDVMSSCILGGTNNIVSGDNSCIAAGSHNYIAPTSTRSFVGGYGGLAQYPSMQAFGIYPMDNTRGGFQRIAWGQWGDFTGGLGVMDFYGYRPDYADSLRFYRVRLNTAVYLNLNVVMSCSGNILDANLYNVHFFSPMYLVFANSSGVTHFIGGESWYSTLNSGEWYGDVQGTFQSEFMFEPSGEYVVFHTRALGNIDQYRSSCTVRGMEVNIRDAIAYEEVF